MKEPKDVCDELFKLNEVGFKGKFLFIGNYKVKSKVTNPNNINFTSPNQVESLRFMSNSPDLGNGIINNNEENDLYVDFKRAVRTSQQNSKYILKWGPPVVVNARPGNKMKFSKVPIFLGDKSFSDRVTKKNQSRRIYWFLATSY